MIELLHRFMADRSGATAVEYGLIAAGIAVAIIVSVGLVGDELSDMFRDVGKVLKKSIK